MDGATHVGAWFVRRPILKTACDGDGEDGCLTSSEQEEGTAFEFVDTAVFASRPLREYQNHTTLIEMVFAGLEHGGIALVTMERDGIHGFDNGLKYAIFEE